MNITHLRYILEIEKCGAINKAAQKLYFSQPHLSNSLKAVEDSLGICIFQRTQNGVLVTEEGKEFLCYAKNIVQQFDIMQEKYDQRKNNSLDLKVACVRSSLLTYPATLLLNKYRGQKKMRISLIETGLLRVVEHVKTGISDIGFLFHTSSNHSICMNILASNNLSYTALGHFRPMVLLKDSDPLIKKDVLTQTDLKDYTYIAYEEFEDSYLSLTNEHRLMDLSAPDKVVFVSDRSTLFTFLTHSCTYTISHRIPGEIAQRYGLVAKAFGEGGLTCEIGYACRKDYTPDLNIELLINEIKSFAKMLDDI